MKIQKLFAGLATALLLTACGGGGGSSDGGIGGTGGGGGGGIGGTGVAYGTITGFGSVWVNGVRYESGSTVFKRDDDNASQSDLRVGMVARVEGSGTTATTISVDSALKGRVEAVSGDRFTVMGQTVQADAQTAFEDGVRPVDHVAFVRFASVYREFKDVRDFVEELEPILAESCAAKK